MNTTEKRDPATLTPHAKVKHLIGRWQVDSDESQAMRRSIREKGILVPLLVTPDNQIMDGVTRWMNARALQLAEVPVLVMAEEECLSILIDTELHRRHHTKGQLAFRLAPMIESAWGERQRRQIASLSRGAASPSPACKTVEEYALEAGVSIALMKQAREIHQLFKQHAETVWEFGRDGEAVGFKRGDQLTFEQYFTARIMAAHDPIGLGAALTGIKQKLSQAAHEARGHKHGGGRPESEERQMMLLRQAWGDLNNRWVYWREMNEDAKENVKLAMTEAIEGAPEDVLLELKRKIENVLKERKA